jgi:IclR family acetate operon transcriptional repressor
VNSVEKTLAVLRALSMPDPPHRLADIADRAELGKTSAHRILQVLVANNHALARGEGVYSPGPALYALGGSTSAQLDLAAVARPILTDLQRTTGHTVHFAVRSGRVAVYVSKIEGDKPYQMASRVGMQIHLHCTSIGKAVLSALPPQEVDAILSDPDERPADVAPTIPDPDTFREELTTIGRFGYAIDDEENEPNVRCVGAPVHTTNGSVLGGISVSGLAFMFSLEQVHAAGPVVAQTAERLSAALGYRAAAAR